MQAIVSRLTLAAGLSLFMLGAAPAGQDLTASQQQAVHDWALNNAEFVLYHEVGHLLIDQLNLPVLGREEDAADQISTWILLKQGTAEAEDTLRDAAQGWLLSGLAYGEVTDSDFYDSHSLSLQRAYGIVCMMVGSDQAHYQTVADEYGIDAERQESCSFDHQTMDSSLGTLLDGQRQAANGHSGTVEVIYQAATGRLQDAAELFKASGVFERIAEELRTSYNLSHHVTFRARRCGVANAFYDPQRVEVTFCYELLNEYVELITPHLHQLQVTEPTSVVEKRK